jgi:hypothetical protein
MTKEIKTTEVQLGFLVNTRRLAIASRIVYGGSGLTNQTRTRAELGPEFHGGQINHKLNRGKCPGNEG